VKREFEKAVNIQTVAFGIVTPCSLVGGYGRQEASPKLC